MKILSKYFILIISLMFIATESYAGRSRTPRFARNVERSVKIEKSNEQGTSLYHNPNRRKRKDEPRFRQGARPKVPGLYVGQKDPKMVQKGTKTSIKPSYKNPTTRPVLPNRDLKRNSEQNKGKKKPVPFYLQKGSTADYQSFGKNTKKYYEYE